MADVLLHDIDLVSDWEHFYAYKQEDIDSGCSSLPSSPSNMSEFSGSTSFDEFSEDLLIPKNDALSMMDSILQGGPVINPYIKIKTDDSDEIDNLDVGLLPSNDNLLEMFMNGVDLIKEDTCLFESDIRTDNCKQNDDSIGCHKNSKSNYSVEKDDRDIKCELNFTTSDPEQNLNVEEEHLVEIKTISRPKSSRKRSISNINIEHSYSCGKHKKTADDNSDNNSTGSQDDKYLEKSRKNNLAAKKSREIKRAKEIENVKKFEKLSKENENLLKEMKKLQALVKRLEGKLAK